MRRNRPSLLNTMARTAVIAGTATAVSGSVAAGQQQKAAAAQQQQQANQAAFQTQAELAALQQQMAEQQAALNAQAAAPAVDAPEAPAAGGLNQQVIDQLQQLGQLRDAGILTEEEFSAKKAKILGL